MATAEWLELFPTAKLYHQSTLASDHSMLLLRMVAGSNRKRVKRSFKFESIWLKESSCEEMVRSAWEEGVIASSGWELNSCLKICRDRLEAWNKDVFGHVGRNISDLQRRLEWLESQPSNPELIQALKFTRAELNCWLEKEDTMWRQRARLNWFQGGDCNTSFFHAKASSRQRKNLIEGLMDVDGIWQEDEGKIEEVVVEYYNNLFTSSSPSNFSELLQAIQPKVTPSMNQMLLKPFTGEEVRLALKQMHLLKAPGPDGMPPLFFQHFWSTSGEVVTNTVLNFLNFGIFPPNFNDTNIVLIPKVKEPKVVTDYRPISLCNMVYKMASKAITNRLKKILPSIISDTQSAFVHGRLITDNVIVTFETMHHISQKKGGKRGEMALKLDMSKAYDRMEWTCLDKIMKKLGFVEHWRRLIMRCVSTISYAININGRPRGRIIPSRGI